MGLRLNWPVLSCSTIPGGDCALKIATYLYDAVPHNAGGWGAPVADLYADRIRRLSAHTGWMTVLVNISFSRPAEGTGREPVNISFFIVGHLAYFHAVSSGGGFRRRSRFNPLLTSSSIPSDIERCAASTQARNSDITLSRIRTVTEIFGRFAMSALMFGGTVAQGFDTCNGNRKRVRFGLTTRLGLGYGVFVAAGHREATVRDRQEWLGLARRLTSAAAQTPGLGGLDD